jgi:UDP-3-O-[3-hydroxymyristoyl] glucosamine N-acyltransferase
VLYTNAMKRSVKEIADLLEAQVSGDDAVEVSGIASIESARNGDVVFVEDEKDLDRALRSAAAAVIAGDFAAKIADSKPMLICEQPRLAFARAAQLFATKDPAGVGVHATAIVHPSAKIGGNVIIEERAVIRSGAEIGAGSRIGAMSVIGEQVRIGQGCQVFPSVTIYPQTGIGNRVVIHAGSVVGSDGFGYVRDSKSGRYQKFPQMGRLEIGDDVEIGANCTVDRGALDVTRIGRGTKIDNLVHIGHNVHIGEDVVIAAQTGLSGSVVVEDNVVIGGQVGIGDHVRIESEVILGAKSGIPSRKIIRGKGVVFWGTPARPIKQYLKELAVLARMAKRH